MELRRLGNSGLKVSVLSLGAMTFGESQTFMKGVADVFVQAGSIDSALDSYDNAVNTGPLTAAGNM